MKSRITEDSTIEQAKKLLMECLNRPDSSVSDEEWERFISLSEEANPKISRLLRKTWSMTFEEYRVALMVVAEIQPRLIEFLSDKKQGYATKVRKRLLEKVFGKIGKASELDTILQKMRQNC